MFFSTLLTALPVAAAGPEVVALGDSLTQGYGLPVEDGLVPQLQGWLDRNGIAAHVTNAGVSGDTTAGGLSRLDWALAPGTQALIVTLGGNDVLRGLPPEQARANLDAILTKADVQNLPVLLIGVPVPGNYGPEYQTAFSAIWPELAAKHGTLYLDNLLAPILARPEAERPALIQADGIHPSAAGVKLVVEALGPKVAELVGKL
jgi:acyl-CoA thioesterase I